MKSWTELTEEEKEALAQLVKDFAEIIDALVDELVPAFEYVLEMITPIYEATNKQLAEGNINCYVCKKPIRSIDEVGRHITTEDGTERYYCKECIEYIGIMKELEIKE